MADMRPPALLILAHRVTMQPLLPARTGTRRLHLEVPSSCLRFSRLLTSDMVWNLGMTTRKAEARRIPRHRHLNTTTIPTDHPLARLMEMVPMSTVVHLLRPLRQPLGREPR